MRKPGQAGGCDLILRMLVALTVKHISIYMFLWTFARLLF